MLWKSVGNGVEVSLVGDEAVLTNFLGQWLVKQGCRNTYLLVTLELWLPEQFRATNPAKPALHFSRRFIPRDIVHPTNHQCAVTDIDAHQKSTGLFAALLTMTSLRWVFLPAISLD